VPLTVALGGIALVSSIGWVIERRRNRRESDSVLWADVQPAASSIVTRVNSLDDILPDNPNPGRIGTRHLRHRHRRDQFAPRGHADRPAPA
jgi:hypothetical protein